MRFSFSTNAFTDYSVFEAVEKIAAAGYEGVEILADIPHLYVHTLKEPELKRLKAVLARTGIQVSNINANTVRGYYESGANEPLFEPCLADPDPGVRAWRVDYTRKCIDLAKALGSSNVSVTSGPIQPETTPEEGIEFLKGSLKSIMRYAEEKRVFIGLEYEPGLLIESGSELSCLISEIGSRFLGANLDLGHSHALGEEPESTINLLDGRIFHVHLEDLKGRKRLHLMPDTAEIDLKGLLSLFERRSYRGFITVDLYDPRRPEEAARRTIEFLRALKLCNGSMLKKTSH
ncbi:MAG: sugar phosphate isomerase/epimerase [Deltaproteobacteria bacterium]|nr:sugar phosphate isomerase/epimerase [Deltaproteobacteria bacterium]MBZ0219622.1 sugar phosphate isomerase/epimerase [Deltaproteobacteria bacterium]